MSSQGKFATTKSEIYLKLSQGATAITANQRLCLNLQRDYAKYQVDQQEQTWLTPTIYPLHIWLENLYQQQGQTKIILSTNQEQLIWQQIIESDSELSDEVMTTDSAYLAKQAWQLFHYWQLPASTITNTHIPEVEAFQRWSDHFKHHCDTQGWISSAEIPQTLLHSNAIDLIHNDIILIGFDELPPVILTLIEQCQHKVNVSYYKPTQLESEAKCIQIAEEKDEITTMARWAKAQLKVDPTKKIACIVPNLSDCHSEVQHIFAELFCPENLLPGIKRTPWPFNISAASPLSHFAIIQTALAALSLQPKTIKLDALSSILLSSYFCAAETDLNFSAELDMSCREFDSATLSIHNIFDALADVQAEAAENTWLNRFRAWQKIWSTLPDKAKPSQWATLFTTLLETLGWPGILTLSSHEYQLQHHWYLLLGEFSQFDLVQQPITYQAALTKLSQLANNTPFHTEGSDMPIQILGVLESGGLEFDAIWVMGLHQDVWPANAKPNPFLPHHIQRQYQMPHADTERELAYTQQTMARFLQSANTIIFSNPQQAGDKALQQSPLLEPFPATQLSELSLADHFNLSLYLNQQVTLEKIQDEAAPPVSKEESIHGGSWILQQQALCPFRAFANVRLHTKGIEEAELGISAADRGTLLHEALAQIWQKIKSHAFLCDLEEEKLIQFIQSALTEVIKKSKPHDKPFDDALYQLEHYRLQKLIYRWLELEKQRAPFRVHAREYRQKIKLNQLSMSIQIDRIDELDDGSYFIIDYKTGITSFQNWFYDPLIEPQLPLYSAYGGKPCNATPIVGMAFAQIRSNQIQLKGVISDQHAHTLTNDKSPKNCQVVSITEFDQDWSQSIQLWQQQLLQLSDDFMQGKADVTPATPQACLYCDLQSLCRINQEEQTC